MDLAAEKLSWRERKDATTYFVAVDSRGAIGVSRWTASERGVRPTIAAVTATAIHLDSGVTLTMRHAEWVDLAVELWNETARDMAALCNQT